MSFTADNPESAVCTNEIAFDAFRYAFSILPICFFSLLETARPTASSELLFTRKPVDNLVIDVFISSAVFDADCCARSAPKFVFIVVKAPPSGAMNDRKGFCVSAARRNLSKPVKAHFRCQEHQKSSVCYPEPGQNISLSEGCWTSVWCFFNRHQNMDIIHSMPVRVSGNLGFIRVIKRINKGLAFVFWPVL